MRLENAEIGQWETKLSNNLTDTIEVTIRAVVIKDLLGPTFASPMVRKDFENYISKYEYGDGLVGGEKTKSELFQELCRVKKELSDMKLENTSLKMKVKDLEDGLEANREEQKEWRQRFLNMRNTLGGLIDSEYGGYLPDDKIIGHFTEIEKELESEKEAHRKWEQKFVSFRNRLGDIFDPMYTCYHDEDDIVVRFTAMRNDARYTEKRNTELEKDLMAVADILQVTGRRTVHDILDKAHYWVHERSVDDEELKMILKMDLDASREDILDRIDLMVKEACECEEAHAALMNVYNACLPAKMNLAADASVMDMSKEIVHIITNKEKLRNMDAVILGDFLSFRDKVKKMVGCESNECSEILDILNRHLEEKKDLSGKLEMICRFRDDIAATLGSVGDYSLDDIVCEVHREVRRAVLLAEKVEFICGYFNVKQIPLTALAENLCLEIKENVISKYKTEVALKRGDAIRDAAKKAGSAGNGVYLDGMTVEQNLRAENVRLKAECEKHKEYIEELEGHLDIIHGEAAAALGYE
jgi:hypothetical protein